MINLPAQTPTRLRGLLFAVVCLLVLASLAVPCILYRASALHSAACEAAIRDQSRCLDELATENRRLAAISASQLEAHPLCKEDFNQLLRLRGEIALLRQSAREVDNLRETNQQLLSAPSGPAASTLPATPDPSIVLAHWPANQLTKAGYSDPQSALQTTLWAMTAGNFEEIMAGVVIPPDKLEEFQSMLREDEAAREKIQKERANLTRAMAGYTGFYVVGQRLKSPDVALLELFFEGDSKTRKVALNKTSVGWKVRMIGRAGQAEDELSFGIFPSW